MPHASLHTNFLFGITSFFGGYDKVLYISECSQVIHLLSAVKYLPDSEEVNVIINNNLKFCCKTCISTGSVL